MRVSLSLVAASWSFVSNTRDVRNNEESGQIMPESKIWGGGFQSNCYFLVFVVQVTDTASGYREDSEHSDVRLTVRRNSVWIRKTN